MPVPSSTNPPSPPDKARSGLFTVLVRILLSIAVFALVTSIGLELFDPQYTQRRVKDAACHAAFADIAQALESYREDFGTYPGSPSQPLVADTRYCIARLQSKGIRYAGLTEYDKDRIVDGEYRTLHNKPIYYTFPAAGVTGPDGKVHPNVKYYLWTWGGIGKGPEAAWEINNWDASK
jgi:type II secretory pathway pseudopilin PulG